MKDEDKLIEIMADLLAEVHEMRTDMSKKMGSVDNRLEGVNGQLNTMNGRIDSLEKQQKRTNLTLSEVRLSFMKLSNAIERHVDYDKRIKKLEKAVFNGH